MTQTSQAVQAMVWSDAALAALQPATKWARLEHRIQVPECIHLGTYAETRDVRALRAIVTIDLLDAWGSGTWLHVSVSRERVLPTWSDLVRAREALGYGDRLFVQLLPPRSHWLNYAGHVLHLWHRLDAATVPTPLWDQVGADGEGYGKPALLDGKS